MDKKIERMRRAKKTRSKIKELKVDRLCVHRTPKHIYAQIIAPNGEVLVCASTVEKEIKKDCGYSGNVDAAKLVGKVLGKRAILKKIERVAFDRSGFKYHGRIKSLADAVREEGVKV